MARKVQPVDHGHKHVAADAPLVGALLRRPFLAVRGHILERLHAAGFTELQAAHLAVFPTSGPDGRSPGDLARSGNASKQAMNNLLSNLEQNGCLQRQVNPDNHRERIVELTPRGHDTIRTIRAAVDELEKRWSNALGADEYETLRALLERLNGEIGD